MEEKQCLKLTLKYIEQVVRCSRERMCTSVSKHKSSIKDKYFGDLVLVGQILSIYEMKLPNDLPQPVERYINPRLCRQVIQYLFKL